MLSPSANEIFQRHILFVTVNYYNKNKSLVVVQVFSLYVYILTRQVSCNVSSADTVPLEREKNGASTV